ncbi:MAG: right-handed parallel beta-helix repeat-containing protein [Pseudomonadota bacterium]
MNKAIAQSIDLMPPPFSDGLDVWSSQNGGPGSNRYSTANNAQVLFTDPDFEECLEIVTNRSPQKLRFTGQTPTPPGCYLRISARVKVVSGIMPDFEIAAWPADAGGSYVPGLVEKGPRIAATEYDKVYEISAIYGSGDRPGVDGVWGLEPVYGHFGLNVVGGANGSSVRIESIRIEDVTSAYLRVMMDWVDVRDFGARGDGVFNNLDAFEAADAAANGRDVLVPEGDYFINGTVELASRFRFEGRIVQVQNQRFALTSGIDYATYLDAFKDERLALEKALQALMNDSGHDGLDLGGRTIDIDRPIDVRSAVANQASFTLRRTIRNGKIRALASANWTPGVVTRTASYTPGQTVLRNVSGAADIEVGSLVTGSGVGRETYVRAVNAAAGEVTLAKPLFGPAPSQSYTFTRFRYLLDFTRFNFVSNFEMSEVSLDGAGIASCLSLPVTGFNWRLHNCWFEAPKDRGITSCGTGDFAMTIDSCEFISNEQNVPNESRSTIALNSNANDIRIRHCRAARFRHFAVLAGTNAMVHANHFFQGVEGSSSRLAGIVFTEAKTNSTITGNYVDNCWLEFSNEHSQTINSGSVLGSATIDGNTFFAANMASSFTFILLRPYAAGMGLTDMTVSDNTFRVVSGSITRVESITNVEGNLDPTRYRNVSFVGNGYDSVTTPTYNPLQVEFTQSAGAASTGWLVESDNRLPFFGRALSCDSMVPTSEIRNANGSTNSDFPWVQPQQGAAGRGVAIRWPQATSGSATVTLRGDRLDV